MVTDVLVPEILGAVLLVFGLTGTILFGLRLFRELPSQNQHRAHLAGLSARERRMLIRRIVRGETVGLPADQVRAQVQLFHGQRHLLGSQLSALLILVAAMLQTLGNVGVFGGFGVFLIGLYTVALVLVVASSVLLGRQVAAGRRYLQQH